MRKIDQLKEPPIIGETYLVPCIIKSNNHNLDIYPIINHLHSDKKTGQNYAHYHIDYRFVEGDIYESEYFITQIRVEKKHSKHNFASKSRYNLKSEEDKNYVISYHPLKLLRNIQSFVTPSILIHNSDKKKCMHKGKCPHKGYDLSQEIADNNGIITCPLHGLKFHKNTGKPAHII